MKDLPNQGDVLRIEKIKSPVLVVSKDYFNQSGEIIGCPVTEHGKEGPLHIFVQGRAVSGYVRCEQLALLDLEVRRFSKVDRISMNDMINITDAIQGIFDYV